MTLPVAHYAAGDIGRVTVVTGSSNTTLAVNAPANVADGDLLVCIIACNATLNPNSIAVATDWVLEAGNFALDGGATTHSAVATYQWNTGDPTTWNFTIGGDTRDDQSVVFRVTGYDPADPINVISAVTTGGTATPVSPDITTTTNDTLAIFAVVARNGNALTADDANNPSGTTLIFSKKTRAFSTGVNTGIAFLNMPTAGATGTKTWSGYLTSSQFLSTVSFAINPLPPSQTITDVNGGVPVKIGGTGTISVLGFTKAITKGTIDGIPLAAASATSITLPGLVDEQQIPRVGLSRTLFVSSADDTETANINIPVAEPDGWASTVIEAGFRTGEVDSIDYQFDPVLAEGDIIFYDPTKGEVFPDAGGEFTYIGTQQLWHHDVSTMIAYSFDLITGSADYSIVARGITMTGLTMRGLTMTGL